MSDGNRRTTGRAAPSRRGVLLSTSVALAGAGCLGLEEEGATNQTEPADDDSPSVDTTLERDWNVDLDERVRALESSSGRAFVAKGRDLAAISLVDGQVLWEFTAEDGDDVTGPFADEPTITHLTHRDGTLYGTYWRRRGDDDPSTAGVVVVDAESGDGETAELVEGVRPQAAPLALDGRLVTGFGDNNANEFHLLGLGERTLSVEWEQDGELIGYNGGVVVDGTAYVSFDASRHRLDVTDGSLEKLDEPGQMVGTRLVARGSLLYYCLGEGGIAVYDLERGTRRRVFETGNDGSSGSRNSGPTVGPEHCYAGFGRDLVAVDRQDGRPVWTHEDLWADPNDDPVGQPVIHPVVEAGIVWTAAEGGEVVGIAAGTGERVVGEPFGQQIASIDAVEGTLLVATERGVTAVSIQ
jgi:outer membrane protein assembly factor BamB